MTVSTQTRRSVLQLLASLPVAATATDVWAAGNKIKVAGIYSAPVDQQWASRLHVALKAAQTRGEIEYGWSESVAYTEMERTLRDWAHRGTSVLVADPFAIEAAARKVAADYPKVAFLMGSSLGPTTPNYSVFDDYVQEACYLCGIVAGGMTKTNVIGMVGGYAIPEVNRLMNGFIQGVRDVNPRAKFLVSFIGSWFDPAKAKETALAQIDGGADFLYAERMGVPDAAKERGVLAVGNLIDQQKQFPETVVVSALWHAEPMINRALGKVKNHEFTAEDYGPYSTMKYGGAAISSYGTFDNKVPETLKKKVAEQEAAIKAGRFKVVVDNKEPKSTV